MTESELRPLTFSVGTTARVLDRSPATVTLWCRTGVLRDAVKIGRCWHIPVEAVEALVGAKAVAR